MRDRIFALTLFAGTAALCVAADLGSKAAVWRLMEPTDTRVVVDGYLQVIRRSNPGGMWSLFAHHGSANLLLAWFSVAAAVGILGWVAFALKAHERLLAVVLGMVLGGALGNMYDRFVFGAVRDFIDAHWRGSHWPTFNLADAFLVCGVAYLMVVSGLAGGNGAGGAGGADTGGQDGGDTD